LPSWLSALERLTEVVKSIEHKLGLPAINQCEIVATTEVMPRVKN
jgi:hypothetical protein